MYRYIKNNFNTIICFKDTCGFSTSLTILPDSIFCIRVRNCFLPSRSVCSNYKEKQYTSFEEFKGKNGFFEKLCKI